MRCLIALSCALAVGIACLAGAAALPPAAGAEAAGEVLLLRVDGAIGPATADYVVRGLQAGARRHVALVVLQIDTPGGLDVSMRDIIKAILASPIPVATWVAPAGARAASAGTYILYASHIAAMAPATTLGAATPVAIGVAPSPAAPEPPVPGSASASAVAGGSASSPAAAAAPPHDAMERKRISDAAAYIRSFALLRGRNAEWAERAVRDAVSLPSGEALAQHVVDVVAVDLADLLRQLDGHRVSTAAGAATLATAHATVVSGDPDWRDRLLFAIGDPSLALMLLLVGFYGLLFEFSSPGMVLPGVIGACCALLGLFGLQAIPVNGVGVALLLLGLAFFAAEVFVPSYGALSIGGLVAFVLGAVMLIDSSAPGFGISPVLIAGLAIVTLGVAVALGLSTARSRRRPDASGPRTMVGLVGEIVEADGSLGWARVQGEHWRVRGLHALQAGDRVRVTRVVDLTLEVEGATR